MALGIASIYGIVFLIATVAVGVGLTWLGLAEEPYEPGSADAETAD